MLLLCLCTKNTEDLGGYARFPRRSNERKGQANECPGGRDEFQPGGEVTPELGFEGWVEFHQADRGGQGLRKWEQLGKKQEAEALGLFF